MNARFLGGPMDGQWVTLPEGAKEYSLALLIEPAPQPTPPLATKVEHGRYRVVEGTNVLQWMGVVS